MDERIDRAIDELERASRSVFHAQQHLLPLEVLKERMETRLAARNALEEAIENYTDEQCAKIADDVMEQMEG
jgi:NifU-like protein involved in Fe-S cluster formation